jgi:RNA ligase
MKFNPPLINNIEEVLPHIEGNPAFIVVDKGWYKVIDYVYMHRDTFTNDFSRECRGFKFCARTGNVIARPYHKFHNLGECAGYFTADVDLNNPHVILDKLDGSMVHTCVDPESGQLRLMTRMGLSPQALQAEAFVDRMTPDGNGLGHKLAELVFDNPTKTFIFEYVGPNNRIVIPYAEEQLIMTGIRDIHTGEYTTMGIMAALAGRYDLPVVQSYSAWNAPVDGLAELIRHDDEKEGAIVRFDTGAMVKMKSAIYVLKHKSKEITESFKGVVQLVIDETMDDVIPQVEPALQEALEDYRAGLLTRLSSIHEGLRHILSLTKDMEQKEFALHIQDHYPAATQRLLFATRKSGDGFQELKNAVKRRYNKEADLENLFEELSLPVWRC